MKRLVIGSGHGAFDQGAIPCDIHQGGVMEAVFNWHQTKALVDYLIATYEVEVILTHVGHDTALDKNGNIANELRLRAKVANDAKADLHVEIHHDATGNKAVRGGSIWIWTPRRNANDPTKLWWGSATGNHKDKLTYPIAKRMAGFIRDGLAKFGIPWRWWEDPDGVACADFGVLRHSKGAALIIEMGHGTNKEDVAIMRRPDFIPTMARVIGDALADALDLPRKVTVPPPNVVLVLVNGKHVDCNAKIEEGKTRLDARPLIEAMSGRIGWDGEKRVLSISTGHDSGHRPI